MARRWQAAVLGLTVFAVTQPRPAAGQDDPKQIPKAGQTTTVPSQPGGPNAPPAGQTVVTPAPNLPTRGLDPTTPTPAQVEKETRDKIAELDLRLSGANDSYEALKPLFTGGAASRLTATALEAAAVCRAAAVRVAAEARPLTASTSPDNASAAKRLLEESTALAGNVDKLFTAATSNRDLIFTLLDQLKAAGAHQSLAAVLGDGGQPLLARRVAAVYLSEVAAASTNKADRKAAVEALGRAAADSTVDPWVRVAATAGLGRVASFPEAAAKADKPPEKFVVKTVTTTVQETEQSGNPLIAPKIEGKQVSDTPSIPSGTTTIAPVRNPDMGGPRRGGNQ